MLARQHAVDRIERHALEQDQRNEQQRPLLVRIHGDEQADDATQYEREHRNLVRRDAGRRQHAHERTQITLKRRLQSVNAGHAATLPFESLSHQYPRVRRRSFSSSSRRTTTAICQYCKGGRHRNGRKWLLPEGLPPEKPIAALLVLAIE